MIQAINRSNFLVVGLLHDFPVQGPGVGGGDLHLGKLPDEGRVALEVDEPAADMAAVLAIASSYFDRPVDDSLVAVGEIGLTGEVRSVNSTYGVHILKRIETIPENYNKSENIVETIRTKLEEEYFEELLTTYAEEIAVNEELTVLHTIAAAPLP